jgi:hypothetical protein
MADQIAEILKSDLGAKQNYQHASKRVTPGGDHLKLPSLLLWL